EEDRRRRSQTAPRTEEREAAESESCRCQSIGKIHQNPRSRAPDVMGTIIESMEFTPAALPYHASALAVRGIEQKGKRNLEHFVHLVRIGRQRKAFAQKPDNGQDREAGAGFVAIQKPRN